MGVKSLAKGAWPFLLVASLNAWVVWKWAGIEYTNRLDSIEWVYLALARHYREWGWQIFRGAAEWFPWWYNGIPVENTYPPLLPALSAVLMRGFNVSNGVAYHWATAGLFVLGPLGVYWVVWRWGGCNWAALFASCFYSLVSFSALAMPSLAKDMTSAWLNERMHVLARYGEGPHLASMALLPWAWWAMRRCCDAPRAVWLALAAVLAAMVLLANLIGGMALAWAGLALGAAYGRRAWLGLLVAGLWAAGISFRFVNIWFLEDVSRNAPLVGGVFLMGWEQYLGLGLLASLVLGLSWWLRRLGWKRTTVAAVGFAIPITAWPLAWEYCSFHFLPQPHRYHLEMEMAWAVLLGLATRRMGKWLSAPLVALLVWGWVGGREYDKWMEPVEVSKTYLARSADEIRRIDPEARLYMTGGPRYFSGLEQWQPQVGGGFLNGMKFRGFAVGDYGSFSGTGNFLDTRDWMVVYGVDYLLVGGKESQDWIRPWVDAGKFVGRLRQVWEEGDDRLYALDRWNQSLAHVLPRQAMLRRTPVSHWGNPDLQAYARALEGAENQGGVWTWEGPSRARVKAKLGVGESIATQVSFDARWEVRMDGRLVGVQPDGLGQMWIEPGRTGEVEVTLRFRNPWWVWMTSVVGVMSAAIFFLRELTRSAWRGRVSK